MSKRKSTKAASKKVQNKSAKARETAQAQAPASIAEEGAQAATLGSRLPPVGTVIKKLDRHGRVRCHCTVAEDGIRYKSRLFGSLSGAAMAAAHDLGLKNKTQNGFTFWGLTKPTRTLADPVAALAKSFGRYHNLAALATSGATDENRASIRSALRQQGLAIESLLSQVAS